MAFTGQLGTVDSRLGNIELGSPGSVSPVGIRHAAGRLNVQVASIRYGAGRLNVLAPSIRNAGGRLNIQAQPTVRHARGRLHITTTQRQAFEKLVIRL